MQSIYIKSLITGEPIEEERVHVDDGDVCLGGHVKVLVRH